MVLGFTKQYIWMVLPLAGYAIGTYLDRKETERMTMFRDKSALYGGIRKPEDPPSWP